MLRPDLVERKIAEYAIPGFESAMNTALARTPDIVESDNFRKELMRFLPKKTVEITLENVEYRKYLSSVTSGLIERLQWELTGPEPSPDPFLLM